MQALQNINNEQFENAVLGAILIDPSIMSKVSASLKPDDFYKTANRKLFELFVHMHSNTVPIDMMTVFECAREKKIDSAIGGAQRLVYLTETTPVSANFAFYAQKVKEASDKRTFVSTLTTLAQEVSGEQISVAEARGLLNEMESSSPLRSKLKFICAKDISPQSLSVQPLWGEMLYPECITQINSEPGVGKTTFVYNLCVQPATGGKFLDIPFSCPLKVLYIDVETPHRKRAIKLSTITDGQIPGGLNFLDSLDMHSQFAELLCACKDEGFDLIVFDTQSRIFNLENENDNSDANRMMNLLRRLVSECGCSVVLVHHTSKSEKKGVYSGRGASAIGGAVDVVVNMEALDPESLKLKADKNRISGDYMTLFIRKTGDEKFEQFIPEGQTLSGFEKFKVQEFILGLSEKKGVWTSTEIVYESREQGFKETTIRRAISNLVQSGKLTKISHGEYEIK